MPQPRKSTGERVEFLPAGVEAGDRRIPKTPIAKARHRKIRVRWRSFAVRKMFPSQASSGWWTGREVTGSDFSVKEIGVREWD